jgi:DNA-binding NarL/FixJ family response regulator
MQLLGESASGIGYLLKDRVSNIAEFIDAVERVAKGGSAIDPTIVSALISKQRNRDPIDRLTPREREVLGLMAEGKSNQGIADEFYITLRAVEKYVSSIFTKLDLPTTGSDSKRVLAVLLYLRG